MVKGQHVIEINGKKYNALTGEVLQSPKTTAAVTKPASNTHNTTKTFDLVPPSRVQRSKTLMRHAVKKPMVLKAESAQKAPKHHAAPTKTSQQHTSLGGMIKPDRAIKAAHIPKSHHISKFGRSHHKSELKTDVIPVKPAPESAPPHQVAAALAAKASRAVMPQNLFENALQSARSHEQAKLKKPRVHHKVARKLHISPRALVVGSGLFVFVVVGSILAYNNVPNVAMRVAATRAGISANLPTYQPAGFSLRGPISYAPGEISINYKSNSDDRDFKVVQRNSDWNSETLLDNFVGETKKPYQTLQQKGRTIYIYDGGNATWVDGGIWYKIEGKKALNSDQLLRIADSL